MSSTITPTPSLLHLPTTASTSHHIPLSILVFLFFLSFSSLFHSLFPSKAWFKHLFHSSLLLLHTSPFIATFSFCSACPPQSFPSTQATGATHLYKEGRQKSERERARERTTTTLPKMMLHPGSQPRHPSSLASDQDSEGNSRHQHGHHSFKPSLDSCSPASIAAANKKQGDYLTALAIMRPRVLDYDVHSCSSYSALYLPENIKVNNPQDQSSRWSSGSNNQMQYIMIKLKTMAIARILFLCVSNCVHVDVAVAVDVYL